MNEKKDLIFFYPSIEIGGLEKNLFSLLNSLSKKKYKIIFITFKSLNKSKVRDKLYSLNSKIKVIAPKINIKTNNRFYSCQRYTTQNLSNFLISNSSIPT